MIEIQLVQWLRQFNDLKTLTPHVYAMTLPKTLLYPAVRVSRLITDFEQTFDGVTGEETANIQVDYWAKTPEQITQVKTALISFFNALHSTQTRVLSVANLREQPSFEPKQNTFKQTLELTLSYK
jgi:hypothetical protein